MIGSKSTTNAGKRKPIGIPVKIARRQIPKKNTGILTPSIAPAMHNRSGQRFLQTAAAIPAATPIGTASSIATKVSSIVAGIRRDSSSLTFSLLREIESPKSPVVASCLKNVPSCDKIGLSQPCSLMMRSICSASGCCPKRASNGLPGNIRIAMKIKETATTIVTTA